MNNVMVNKVNDDVFKSLAEYGTVLYITSWLKKKNLMENINTLEEVDQFSPLLT